MVDADWRVDYSKNDACWDLLIYSKWVDICWILWNSRVLEAWNLVRLSEVIPDNRSRNCYFRTSLIGPEFWPGNVALSWLMLMIEDIWTFDKVVLVSLSWVTLEAQDLWSHLFAFDVILSLVDQQGRYTLPRELLLIFLKWTVSWLRQIEDPSTRIFSSFIISGGKYTLVIKLF